MILSGGTVAIHQPEYFPWLGLLDKARRADVLVLLDTVQFDRSSLQHRAKIVGANGPAWLTIPFVHRFPQNLDEVQFVDMRWATKHRKSLQAAYGRAPGYIGAAAALDDFFSSRWERLVDATIASVHMLLSAFRVETPVVNASKLGARGEKAELVLNICRELSAHTYLSGRSGASYLNREEFAAEGINLLIQSFRPPPYLRHRPLALPDDRGLSGLDAWLELGEDAADLLNSGVSDGDDL